MHNSRGFKPYLEFETGVMLLHLLDEPESFYEEMGRYSGSVTIILVHGWIPKADHPIVHKINDQYFTPGKWLVDWLPFLDSLPEPLAPWRGKASSFYYEHIKFWLVFHPQMKERVQQGAAPDCFMPTLLQEKGIGNISDEEATGLLASLLSAGSETTATALKWFTKATTKFPGVVKTAKEEIDRVVENGRMPGWEGRDNLPYVEAMVNELHRWASLAPLAFQHSTTADDVYRGWQIPKNTFITPNTGAFHYNPEIFPEPEKFIPVRFLPKNDVRCMTEHATIDYHYGYGIGRRVWAGHHVADASLYIAICRLLWAFDLGPKPGAVIDDVAVAIIPVFGPRKFEAKIAPLSPEVIAVIRREGDRLTTAEMEDAALYEKYFNGLL